MALNMNDFWKLLSEIQGSSTDLTDSVKAIAKNEKTVSERLFSNIIDQLCYNSQDYQRFRSFLRDWYAAHRSITSFEANVSDIYQLPNDQLDDLFQSFGYNYSTSLRDPISNTPPLNKVNFFLDLVNLYKIKGTPQALLNVLQYYGVSEVDLYELSLQFDDRPSRSQDDLIFKGKVVTGTTGDTSPIYLPFDLLTQGDPHWLQSESAIRQLFDLNKINFPSQSPYFAVKPLFDEEAIDATTGILKRKVQDEYEDWEDNGFPPEDTTPILDQDAIISITGDQCSLLTLYLSCVYVFNQQYNVGSPADRFICYDGTNTDPLDIITEFREVTSKPISRADQRNKYDQYLDTFSRDISFSFLQNHSDAEGFLATLNPTVKSNLDNLATDNNTILGSLLRDLGEWARSNISYGYINMSYILFGIDSLFSQLRDVVNFFKPYRTRIVPLELLQLKNRLLNTIVVEDSFELEQDLTFHDFLVGDSIPCCSDATCSAYVSPREYYDCGSNYDIGAVVDNDDVRITLDDSIHDRLMCVVGCKERNTVNPYIFTNSVDIAFEDIPLNDNYTTIVNVYNLEDDSPSMFPYIVTNKSTAGFSLEFAENFDSDNYYVTWNIIQSNSDQTSNFGIETIPNGVDEVTVNFSQPQNNPNYALNITMENTQDSILSYFLYTIIDKTVNGFTVKFSDIMPNGHYAISWSAAEYGKEDVLQDGWTQIPNGEDEITVNFNCPCEYCDNFDIALSVVNTVDGTPSKYGYILTNKTSSSFTVKFSSPMDSDNYYLSWTQTVPAQTDQGYVVSEVLSGVNEPQAVNGIEDYSYIDVVFDEPQTDLSYSIVTNLFNTQDFTTSIYPYMITNKTLTGFRVSLTDTIDTDYLFLAWDISTSSSDSGIQPIPNGTNEVTVVFDSTAINPFYSLNVTVENTDDTSVSYFLYTITEKTTSGFKVKFSDIINSGNYYLNWKKYEYARDVGLSPEDGYVQIPEGSSTVTIPFGAPYELFNQYGVGFSIVNTDDTSVSYYSANITAKNIDGFEITLSSPTDSPNYYISWAQYRSSSIIFENFQYRQSGQFRDFDEDGTFDCTYGRDHCDIEIFTETSYLLQEDGDFLLQEDGSGIYL